MLLLRIWGTPRSTGRPLSLRAARDTRHPGATYEGAVVARYFADSASAFPKLTVGNGLVFGGEYRIRVNSIGPGWVETRLTADYLADPSSRREVEATVPLGRVGQPEDIASAAVFFAGDESSYVTGAHLRIDPGLLVGKDKT